MHPLDYIKKKKNKKKNKERLQKKNHERCQHLSDKKKRKDGSMVTNDPKTLLNLKNKDWLNIATFIIKNGQTVHDKIWL